MLGVNPVFLALLAHSAGFYIYSENPQQDVVERSKAPAIIFSTGIFVLVAYSKVFTNQLYRTCPWPFHCILQFLGGAYVIELMQATMWLPIQNLFHKQLPMLAGKMETECGIGGSLLVCTLYHLLDLFVLVSTTDAFFILLSTIFLGCCLHMTNLVNLQLLRCGPKRLIALLIQYLMRSIGIKDLICDEDITKLCGPISGGGRGEGRGRICEPPSRTPRSNTPSRIPRPITPSRVPVPVPRRPLPILPRSGTPPPCTPRRPSQRAINKNNNA